VPHRWSEFPRNTSISRVVPPVEHAVVALFEAGLLYMRAGQYFDAHVSCQQALVLDPNHAETMHLMGLLCLQSEQYEHAVEWIARALKQNPKPEYLYRLGTTLRQQGRFEEALMSLDKAVQLRPDKAELWIGLGRVLGDLKRPADALLSFQHAFKLNPRQWEAAQEAGAVLGMLGRSEEALGYFRMCYELQPDHPATLKSLTSCLLSLKKREEALTENQRAYERNPGNAASCDNIGVILELLGREEEALSWLDRALALRPDFVDAINDKALVLGKLHRFDESAATYRHAESLDPDNAATMLGLSHLYLLRGDFESGWVRHKTRLRMNASTRFSQPMWLGARVSGWSNSAAS